MTDLNPVDAMTTDYRAMCADLLSEAIYLGSVPSAFPPSPELVARARALLAQPVAEGPTDEELQEMWFGSEWFNEGATLREFISITRTVLARWGHPTPQPVAVSERLPRPEDCLDEGWAWFFNQRIGWRQAVLPVSPGYTHWLPAHALPVPLP